MILKTKDNITVGFNSVYIDHVYHGQLIGWPDKEGHEEIIKESVAKVRKNLCTAAPAHLIEPKISRELEICYIPHWRIGVSLESIHTITNDDSDGSWLMLVFFVNKLDDIREMIKSAIADLEWEKHAQNFCW